MKKWHLALLLVLLMPISYSATQYVQDYNNFLTRSIADDIYYQDGDNGTFSNLIVGNLSVWDSYFNVSVVNYNVTGDINMSGCVNFPDGSSICNLTYFNDTFLRKDGDYANGTYVWNYTNTNLQPSAGVEINRGEITNHIFYPQDNGFSLGFMNNFGRIYDIKWNSSRPAIGQARFVGDLINVSEFDFGALPPSQFIVTQREFKYNKLFGRGTGIDSKAFNEFIVNNEYNGATASSVALTTVLYGNTSGDLISISSVAHCEGSGACIGFRGLSYPKTGYTGTAIGIDAYINGVPTEKVQAVRALGAPFGTYPARNKTYAFYSSFGHTFNRDGSIWVCDICDDVDLSNPSDYLNTNGDGQGFFESSIESQGTAFINNVFGSLWNYTEGGYDVELSTFGVYQNITNLTQGEVYGMSKVTADNGKDRLQLQYDGVYKIDTTLSFDGSSNHKYGFGVVINYAPTPERNCYVQRDTSGTAIGNIGTTCILSLNAGDNISLVIEDEINPAFDPSIHEVSLTVLRVGNG